MQKHASTKTSSIFLMLATMLIVALFGVWSAKQKKYPDVDSSQMYSMTQEIYKVFQEQGPMTGVSFAYTHKHWRPLLFPVVMEPILYLTSGNIFYGLKVIFFLMLLVAIFIVFKYVQLFSDPWIRFLTFIFFFLSYLFSLTLTFMGSEIFLVTGFLSLFYFWFKNHGRLKLGKEYYFFMAIWSWTCLCRPVEALTLGLPLFLMTTWSWYQEKIISIFQIFSAFFLGTLGIAFLVLPYFFLGREWGPSEIVLVFFGYVSLAFFFSHRTHWADCYLKGFLLFLTPLILWFAIGSYTLLEWVSQTSFGPLAIGTGGASGKAYFQFWLSLCQTLGYSGQYFVGLGFILLLSKEIRQKKFFILVTGYLFLNIFLSSLTYNWDHRYCFPNLLCLVLVCGKVISDYCQKATLLKRQMVICSLSVMAIFLVNDWCQLLWKEKQPIGFFAARNVFSVPTDAPRLKRLVGLLEENIHEKETVIGVMWHTSWSIVEINGWVLQMALMDSGKNWIAKNIMGTNGAILSAYPEGILSRYQYLLVGPVEEEVAHFSGNDLGEKWLLESCNPVSCSNKHLEFIATLGVSGDSQARQTYYLVKSKGYLHKPFPLGFD